VKTLVTATKYVLALPTLGDTTKKLKQSYILSRHPLVAVAGIIALDFANVKMT
jgi:hypothetical protein